MKFCDNCGEGNPDDAAFCVQCGTKIEAVAEEGAPPAGPSPAPEGAMPPPPGAVPPAAPGDLQQRPPEAMPPPPPGIVPPPGFAPPAGPPGTPPGVAPPGAPPGYPTVPRAIPSDGMAVASLILGIAGFFVCWLLFGVLAVVFGYMGRKRIEESNGTLGGDAFCTAGIILGFIQIGLTIFIVAIWAIIAIIAATSTTSFIAPVFACLGTAALMGSLPGRWGR